LAGCLGLKRQRVRDWSFGVLIFGLGGRPGSGFCLSCRGLDEGGLVVAVEEGVEIDLHLREVFIPGFAALDAEVFIEEGAVEAFEIAVGLRPADLGGAVLDAFELEEELVGVLVRPAAELAAVVGEDGFDRDLVGFEERQDVVVEEMDGGERHF